VPDVWINLAHAHLVQGEYIPAIKSYQAALDKFYQVCVCCVCVRVCTMYVCMYEFVGVCLCAHVHDVYMLVCICKCVCVCVCMYIYIHTHVHTYIMYTYTHTTHAHTQGNDVDLLRCIAHAEYTHSIVITKEKANVRDPATIVAKQAHILKSTLYIAFL
jgi:hypothetical protein